ncbi:MAG TPA: epoxide hydrolase N-terminal domain-containing protein, partial [Nitrososphaeraceae archaeon]|nr:epoxide hydrolase N-terminal domain-containing protein [Nitrososphaeraceae archaeon]
MSDEQDSLKYKQFSRREFLKLLGAGSLSLGVGIFGISNILKTFREASALTQGTSPVLQGNMSNNKNITNNMNNLNTSDIRPFHVNIPEEELIELRRRINATRWPEKETVMEPNFRQRGAPNWGQGVQLATMQKLARYWSTDYDWRKI